MAVYRENKGFTIIELLIAMVLAVVLTTAAYRAFTFQQKSYTVQDQVTEMQQALRATMMTMVREIRMAGFIAEDDEDGNNDDISTDIQGHYFSNGVNEDIEEAASDSICFETDIDDSGRTDTIRYYEENGQLKRRRWQWDGVGWQDLGDQIVSENFQNMNLTYILLDKSIDPPVLRIAPPWPPWLGRKDIRMVRLDLEFRTLKEDPDYLAGQDINGDANDGTCRTRRIVRHIKLRNMSMSGL